MADANEYVEIEFSDTDGQEYNYLLTAEEAGELYQILGGIFEKKGKK